MYAASEPEQSSDPLWWVLLVQLVTIIVHITSQKV